MTYRLLPFALSLTLLIAGCANNPFGDPKPEAGATPPPPQTMDMSGPWRLLSLRGQSCTMTFAAEGAEGTGGTVKPEGRCPGNFNASRRWVYDQGTLVIQDQNRKQLAAMKQNPSGSFDIELPNRDMLRLER